jgi:hypothetical protein
VVISLEAGLTVGQLRIAKRLERVKTVLRQQLGQAFFSIFPGSLCSLDPRRRHVLAAWTKQKKCLDDTSSYLLKEVRFLRHVYLPRSYRIETPFGSLEYVADRLAAIFRHSICATSRERST